MWPPCDEIAPLVAMVASHGAASQLGYLGRGLSLACGSGESLEPCRLRTVESSCRKSHSE